MSKWGERAFLFDQYDSWFGWHFLLTKKNIQPPELKTNYVDLGGVSGSIDLSEALTGEPAYKDRVITATFWSDDGTYDDREQTLRSIINCIHGKRMKIYEPDCPGYYFLGRVRVTSVKNTLAYAEFSIEATCDPLRYGSSERRCTVSVENGESKEWKFHSTFAASVCPKLTVTGDISFTYDGITSDATAGEYLVAPFKLHPGDNVITVSGSGTLTITFREVIL